MEPSRLKKLVADIVKDSQSLKDDHTEEVDAPVNYACIFSRDRKDFEEMVDAAQKIGRTIDNTPTGPLFHIKELRTAAGPLKILKIRKYDEKAPERGDADFTVANYESFKQSVLKKPGFKLIQREKFEMIELRVKGTDILVYFSHPTLEGLYKIK